MNDDRLAAYRANKFSATRGKVQYRSAELIEHIDELEAKLADVERQRDQWDAIAVKGLESIKELEAKLAEAEKTAAEWERRYNVAVDCREADCKEADERAEAAEARVRELETQLQTMVAAYDKRIDVITGKP